MSEKFQEYNPEFNHKLESKINYLDEKLNITFDFNEEAARHLPEITLEEIKARKEKYAALLGKVNIKDEENLEILIKGVLQIEGENHGYYKEGIHEVSKIKTSEIVQLLEKVKEANEEYRDFDLVGEIHTHPIYRHDSDSCNPSKGDMDSIIDVYEKQMLTPDKPYIFGIAGVDKKSNTQYAFYRLIKKADEYSCMPINAS
ncbi:MAG: hypothetical protein V1732_03655 [Patescibacteria group bacterium]